MRNRILIAIMAIMIYSSLAVIAGPVWAGEDDSSQQKIQAKVEKRLQDQKLWSTDMNVAIEGNNVILTGNIRDLHQKAEIEKQAQKASRGYDMIDNLGLTQVNSSDEQLTSDVLKQLRNNVAYSVFDWVGIDVTNGTAVLTGWVYQPWHKRQFEHEVANVAGITKIDDQIQLESFSEFDDEIRSEAANLIYNDPGFRPYAEASGLPIHIVVDNGKVYLEGVVARTDMSNWAENTIYLNTKAFQVFDDLKVEDR